MFDLYEWEFSETEERRLCWCVPCGVLVGQVWRNGEEWQTKDAAGRGLRFYQDIGAAKASIQKRHPQCSYVLEKAGGQ